MSTETLNLEYHYGTEAESYSFYRIPKILISDERFSKVSIDAKFLYGLMLDRMGLSMKNGWFDKDNKVFIYFTLEDAVNKLGCSTTKAVKLFSELDTVKGIGLIERKKQGQGKPTIIYVKSFATLEKAKACKIAKSEDINLDENTENNEFKGGLANDFTEDEEEIDSDNNNAKVLNLKNKSSRVSENEIQDFQNVNTNNTYISNTDFSDTESINQSFSKKQKQKNIDGLIERKNQRELEKLVYDEMDKEQTLPYIYVTDSEKMQTAIKMLVDYDVYKRSAEKDRSCEFEFSVLNLFTEALTEMLTTKGNMNLKGSLVTYSKVYDKLVTRIDFSGYSPTIFTLFETVKCDFTNALEQYEIKNYLQYMKSCIWNALQVGDIDVQAFVKRVCP